VLPAPLAAGATRLFNGNGSAPFSSGLATRPEVFEAYGRRVCAACVRDSKRYAKQAPRSRWEWSDPPPPAVRAEWSRLPPPQGRGPATRPEHVAPAGRGAGADPTQPGGSIKGQHGRHCPPHPRSLRQLELVEGGGWRRRATAAPGMRFPGLERGSRRHKLLKERQPLLAGGKASIWRRAPGRSMRRRSVCPAKGRLAALQHPPPTGC